MIDGFPAGPVAGPAPLEITFGDLRQKDSAVNRQKTDPRHYALLEHLGTRPRTTYLSDVLNRAPGFDEDAT